MIATQQLAISNNGTSSHKKHKVSPQYHVYKENVHCIILSLLPFIPYKPINNLTDIHSNPPIKIGEISTHFRFLCLDVMTGMIMHSEGMISRHIPWYYLVSIFPQIHFRYFCVL